MLAFAGNSPRPLEVVDRLTDFVAEDRRIGRLPLTICSDAQEV